MFLLVEQKEIVKIVEQMLPLCEKLGFKKRYSL